jgi:hypothetical protein
MQPKSRQRGISFLGLLFVGGVLAVVRRGRGAGVSDLRRIPGGRQGRQKGQQRQHGGRSAQSIFDRADLEVDNITSIKAKDLEITKDGDKIVVKFAYQREIHLAGPAYLTLKYSGRVQQSVDPQWLALQQRLQHVFSNADLLGRALTHRSFGATTTSGWSFWAIPS